MTCVQSCTDGAEGFARLTGKPEDKLLDVLHNARPPLSVQGHALACGPALCTVTVA